MDGVHNVVAALHHGVLPQADFVDVAPAVAQVTAVLEEGSIAHEALVDGDGADTGMGTESSQSLFLRDLPAVLAGGQDSDDVAVGHRGMDQDAGSLHMGHDGHEVNGLMGGSLVDLQGVGQSAVVVTGVSHTADDGDGNLVHTVGTVQAVHSPDEAGGVAGSELQVVLAQALFIVGIAMEEHIGDAVLLAALEDGLYTHLLVNDLVLRAHAAGSGVQHNVNLAAQLLKGAGHGDVLGIEGGTVRAVYQIEVILDAVSADHVVFPQSADCQGGGQVSNADKLHILLHGNAVRQTLTDGAVTRDAYSYFSHNPISS